MPTLLHLARLGLHDLGLALFWLGVLFLAFVALGVLLGAIDWLVRPGTVAQRDPVSLEARMAARRKELDRLSRSGR